MATMVVYWNYMITWCSDLERTCDGVVIPPIHGYWYNISRATGLIKEKSLFGQPSWGWVATWSFPLVVLSFYHPNMTHSGCGNMVQDSSTLGLVNSKTDTLCASIHHIREISANRTKNGLGAGTSHKPFWRRAWSTIWTGRRRACLGTSTKQLMSIKRIYSSFKRFISFLDSISCWVMLRTVQASQMNFPKFLIEEGEARPRLFLHQEWKGSPVLMHLTL